MVEGQNGNQFQREALERHLDQCVGKSLGEIDVNHAFRKAEGHPKVTGIAGDVIEQSVLFLRANSRQEPDIVVNNNHYEVKTTGVRAKAKGQDELEAKEPMSITAVSPHSITSEDYWNSSFFHKVERMLLFYYLYSSKEKVSASDYASFPLLSYQFHEYDDFSEEEKLTLEHDWTTVRNFIHYLQEVFPENYESQYPRISHDLRRALLLLDTAPKWPHPPRFRFKRSFVTSIFRRHMETKKRSLEILPECYTEIRNIEDKCGKLTRLYKGWTIEQLCQQYDLPVSKELKSIAEPVIIKMFGGTRKKMRDVDLFSKIGMVGKSIVLTQGGARTEDTKFFTIDFSEFLKDALAFEDSQFYEFFSSCRILFVVFEEPSPEAPLIYNRFMGFKMITFDEDFIENNVRPVWNRIRHLITTNTLVDEPKLDKFGRQVINKNGERSSAPNFPKSSEGLVFVRGTGTDSRDKRETVNGIRMYYQQVWIKGSYLAELLEDDLLIS